MLALLVVLAGDVDLVAGLQGLQACDRLSQEGGRRPFCRAAGVMAMLLAAGLAGPGEATADPAAAAPAKTAEPAAAATASPAKPAVKGILCGQLIDGRS